MRGPFPSPSFWCRPLRTETQLTPAPCLTAWIVSVVRQKLPRHSGIQTAPLPLIQGPSVAYEEDGADTLVSGSQPGPPAEHTTLSVRMISLAGLSFIYFPCILCVCVCASTRQWACQEISCLSWLFLEIVFTVISVGGMLYLGRVPGCVCVS